MAARKTVLIACAVLALALSASADVIYTITGATGTYSDATTGVHGIISGVFPANDPQNDNLLHRGGGAYLDAFGITLDVAGTAVNLSFNNGYVAFANGTWNTAGRLFVVADPNLPNTYDFWNIVHSSRDSILSGKFTVSAQTPEPPALILLGTGLLGFWPQRKRWLS